MKLLDLPAQINSVLSILNACFLYHMYMFVSHTGSESLQCYFLVFKKKIVLKGF